MPSQASICIVLLFILGITCIPSLAALNTSTCTHGTCLNGGICDKNYSGKYVKCICPKDNRTDYGPRCEKVTRSYYLLERPTDGTKLFMSTIHGVSSHPFYPNKLVITMDVMAHCTVRPCYIFVMKGADKKSLFTIERTPWCQTHIWSPAVSNHTDWERALSIPNKFNTAKNCAEFWDSISVHMWKSSKTQLTTHFQLCSQKNKQCAVKSHTENFDGDLMSKFKDSEVSIGNMFGCIRFPRVNGVVVDLGETNLVDTEGLAQYSDPYCYHNKFSCLKMEKPTSGRQSNYCGTDSICEGEMKVSANDKRPCKCWCINDMRRQRETISNNDMCTSKPEPSNECTIATPIINTVANDFNVQWTTNTNGPIGVGLKFITIELSLKTREMHVDHLIALVSGKAKILYIEISNGLPTVCTVKYVCYNFPTVSVADGQWHSLYVSIRNRELIAMLDMRAENYVLDSEFQFSGAKVEMSIPNSCIRSIRLSNIYLPTSVKDATADNDTMYIKQHRASGAESMESCKTVSDKKVEREVVSCNGCRSDENCDMSSVKPQCICKKGTFRNDKNECMIEESILRILASSGGSQVSSEFVQVATFANLIIASFMVWRSLIRK